MAAIVTATIQKRARVTVAQYSIYDDNTGEMVPQKALVLKGLRDKGYVKKQLLKALGPDVEYVVTSVSAGEHVFAMSVADFIRQAPVVDGRDADGNEVDPGKLEAEKFGVSDAEADGDADADSGDDVDSPDDGDDPGEEDSDTEEDDPF